jgi:exopolyphosphatase/guanosine-5'-triphosphate,3'-diphosphate pyrophosphatase
MQRLLGVVDIGTSSIKISVFECGDGGCRQVAFSGADIRLVGQNSAVIGADRRDSAIEIVKNLISFGRNNGAEGMICIATHAVRSAKNAHDFLLGVKSQCGLDVDVLSGRGEAELICESVKSVECTENFFSFDVGGGSVEFNIFEGVHTFSASKGIGAISLTEILRSRRLEPSLDSIGGVVRESMDDIPVPRRDARIICTGGCLSIAGKLLGIPDGKITPRVDLESLFRKIAPMSIARRIAFGIPRGRVDVFGTALGIAVAVLSLVGRDGATISEANVRHGVALKAYHLCKNDPGENHSKRS